MEASGCEPGAPQCFLKERKRTVNISGWGYVQGFLRGGLPPPPPWTLQNYAWLNIAFLWLKTKAALTVLLKP